MNGTPSLCPAILIQLLVTKPLRDTELGLEIHNPTDTISTPPIVDLQRLSEEHYNMQHEIWLKRVLIPFWVVEFAWLSFYLVVDCMTFVSYGLRYFDTGLFVQTATLHLTSNQAC